MEGGASTEISVSLNRIDQIEKHVTVTVTIDLPAGSGLTVMYDIIGRSPSTESQTSNSESAKR